MSSSASSQSNFLCKLYYKILTMNIQVILLRSAVISGMIAVVLTILYFTPIPGKYFLKINFLINWV